jgi:hypothetical protein
MRVNHVADSRLAQQRADVMRLPGIERLDVAATEDRRNCTCRGGRLTWATTGAVVTGTMPNSSRARWSAHA